ncbi:MAG: sulfatase [Deltaproteobacteria bacterium]|nr:sulfatase [Deltaproteobacteria bacterium]
MSLSLRHRAALVALLCCALAGCAAPPPRPNVLVVLVDTLRPDRLGAYGNQRQLTPFLDELAARSTVFGNAYAQSSWTNPSVASLFTSRYQSQHRVTSFGSVLAADEQTLAEVLRQHGYATAAFSANFLLQPKLGFDQGFDVYKAMSRPGVGAVTGKPKLLKARAETINQAVLGWLDGRQNPAQPAFLYVHYMEPHAPYDPPADALARAFGATPQPDLQRINDFMEMPGFTADDEVAAAARLYYDAEVTALDASLRALFAGLEQRGFLRDAVVVLLADHGEELKEHGLLGHHQTLYEEVIRIPLMIQMPGQTTRQDIAAPVETLDIAPTLLARLGIEAPASFVGVSLDRKLPGAAPLGLRQRLHAWLSPPAAPTPRPVYSELIKDPGTLRLSQHERAAIDGGNKAIADVDGQTAYYDLQRDPGETNRDGVAAAPRGVLDRALAALRRLADGGDRVPGGGLDEQTKERMRALGYAE